VFYVAKTWIKPCIKHGSCPFDELDTSKEKQNTLCSIYGYECPSFSFAEKILESENPTKGEFEAKADELLLSIDDGIDVNEKYIKARDFYDKALNEDLKPGTGEYGVVMWKQGIINVILANEGQNSKDNYQKAISLFREARQYGLRDGPKNHAEALVLEAIAYIHFSYYGGEASCYRKAIELYEEARRHGFDNGTHEYASTLVDQAVALNTLTEYDSISHKEEIISLLNQAKPSGLRNNTGHDFILNDMLKNSLFQK
jgi:tetratricopeptide (TPR) repeat protein